MGALQSAAMDEKPTPEAEAAARAALHAFLRRLLTRMANEAQRDSLAYRKALEQVS